MSQGDLQHPACAHSKLTTATPSWSREGGPVTCSNPMRAPRSPLTWGRSSGHRHRLAGTGAGGSLSVEGADNPNLGAATSARVP